MRLGAAQQRNENRARIRPRFKTWGAKTAECDFPKRIANHL